MYAQNDSILCHEAKKKLDESNFKAALSLFSKAADLNSKSLKANFGKGMCYYYLKNSLKSIESFKNVIRIDSNYIPTYDFLAIIYLEWDKYDSCNYYINKSLKKDSTNGDAYNTKANYFSKINRFNEAEKNYLKAIKYSNESDLKVFCHNLGELYFDKKEYKKAIEYATKAIINDNSYLDAYELRARSYEKLKNKEKADEDWIIAEKLKKTQKTIIYTK